MNRVFKEKRMKRPFVDERNEYYEGQGAHRSAHFALAYAENGDITSQADAYHLMKNLVALIALLFVTQLSQAGPIRDWLKERRQHTAESKPTTIADISYGSDARQRMDVYMPPQAHGVPVIFMVHGGAWAIGDKQHGKVVENKLKHWLPRGVGLVSVNYRLVPQVTPTQQLEDITKALGEAQSRIGEWGGDPKRFILMGHSAGAHLVALLNADPDAAQKSGAAPWLGAVLLDSAAMDLVKIMQAPQHYRFYDQAFGQDPAYWLTVSPIHKLNTRAAPMLAVCSTQRAESCAQASALVNKAQTLGVSATLLPQALSHSDINGQLGLAGAYTTSVDAFIDALPGFKPDANR